MRKFIGKSNDRILCKLSKSEILRLYSIIHVAMETTKTSHFTCRSKSFISIFFTCQVSACELQPFSCHDLTNDIYSQTANTVFRHLNSPWAGLCYSWSLSCWVAKRAQNHLTLQNKHAVISLLARTRVYTVVCIWSKYLKLYLRK